MKKQMMMAFVVMNLIASCGQQSGSEGQLEAAKVGKTYIAVVKQSTQTAICAESVRKVAGVSLKDVLSEIGAISFVASKNVSEKVAKLNCISSVEEEMVVGTNDPRRGAKGYIAVVERDVDISTSTVICAKKIAKIKGVTVTSILEVIGMVVFKASPSVIQQVQTLSCVMSVDEEKVMYPAPSTRIGN